jgi:tetratricopeptide (TPR) repeat protein
MNKIKLILSLTAAMVLSGAVAAQTLDEVNNKFNEAGAAMQARDFEKSAALFEEAIQMGAVVGADAQPVITQAQTYLLQSLIQAGSAAATSGDFPKSTELLGRARDRAELYGNNQLQLMAGQRLGQVFRSWGADAYNNQRYDEAIDIFGQGYAADPRNTDMALNLADSYAKTGDLEKALEVYDAVIALESTHSRYAEPAAAARAAKATAVLVKASEAVAANNLDEVVRLTDLIPDDPTGAMLRLQLANNSKNYQAVIQYGEAAAELQTDPDMKSNAYFLLGAAYQNLDNKAKAIESFRKVTSGVNAAQARTLITTLQQ